MTKPLATSYDFEKEEEIDQTYEYSQVQEGQEEFESYEDERFERWSE